MNNIIKALLVSLLLLSFCRCTTVRPTSLGQSFKRDTVYVRSTFINNPTVTTEGIKLITVHDTLLIKETIVKTTEAVTDTAVIGKYLNQYFENAIEIVELKKMLLALQLLFPKTRGTEIQQNKLLEKLDTAKREKFIAQREVAATKIIIYQVPTYFYIFLLMIVAALLLYYNYLKAKLKRKQIHASR